MTMLSQTFTFVGVLLLIVAQVQSFEYLKDVIARAKETLALYESGRDTGKPVYMSKGVALDVGNLNRETFQFLPEDLKISIAGCHRLLSRSASSDYDEILSLMMQSPLIQPKEDSSINRMDKFMPEITAWWNFLGKSKATKMQELNNWFLQLITNSDFVAATQLHAKSSLSMAKTTMLMFKKLRKDCKDKEKGLNQRDIIDLAVLQYPQGESETFLLHRVRLFGWVDCKTSNRNGGITGEYTKREFTSRYTIISELSPSSREKALSYIAKVFDSIEPETETPTADTTTKSAASSEKPSILMSSTAAAITTAATIPKNHDDDDDDDVC